jgi:simple sugar transport system ATP-binding protein
MVGRAFAQRPEVLVVINPTVGVDVASKEALLDALGSARDRGVAVLLVSDDFEDLRICTRLLVMVRGRVARELGQPPWDRETLIACVEGLDERKSLAPPPALTGHLPLEGGGRGLTDG